MPFSPRLPSALVLLLTALAWFPGPGRAAPPASEPQTKDIPEALRPWEGWATWNDETRGSPTPYDDPKQPLPFWPSRLGLRADRAGGRFDLDVTTFHETWVPLPGGADVWPMEVTADGGALPVVAHGGGPAVRLSAGMHRLEGVFRWGEPPRGLPVPREIGLLALVVDGQPVAAPTWDAQGFLWLRRAGAAEPADKDFLSTRVYAALEDGIPLWLRVEIELTVSGKSREEDLGAVLPEGWKLAAVESALPVAVDPAGRMRAQVRAGKWTVRADAFRTDDARELRFAPDAKPAAADLLVAFRSRPDFRTVEITGAPAIDVSQTTFPERWRELPVFRWEPASGPLRIEERMRGMGQGKPAGLSIARTLWLDENGRGLTFRDGISGAMQRVWRLDAAPGTDLGSVRSAGQGQLITRNPQTAAPGVEVRTRAVNLEATGRMARAPELSAVGWQADAETLNVTLNLPPGWRLFALFGSDWVRGDWLTAWTLLDLFLLLIFTLAVGRLWGWAAGALAFCAFALAYHEPGAPRYAWLALLAALALARVVPAGAGRRLVTVGKWLCLVVFVLVLVPFVTRQVQQAIYPQLERVGSSGEFQAAPGPTGYVTPNAPAAAPGEPDGDADSAADRTGRGMPLPSSRAYPSKAAGKENLLFDAKAKIQTGPGVPEWSWRTVSFGWNGPVQAGQRVRPVLVSSAVERVLTVLRVLLVLALAAVLLDARRWGGWLRRTAAGPRTAGTLAAVLLTLGGAVPARAQFPEKALLDALRQRLLETPDAYPNAADLPAVTLTLTGRRLVLEAEVHAAIQTAVPLPGRLPAWSPVAVTVDDKPEAALRRADGYLWIALPPGVHRVRVEGMLPEVTEWEWTYQLKPRRVRIEAPGWTFNGVRPDGVPEAQVFFTRQEKAAAATGGTTASYDRNEFQALFNVDRQLELGLVWQVRTTVQRLTPAGKAAALRLPLLPGENVLSADAAARDGFIEVRLGAQELTFTWESTLTPTERLELATRAGDPWVERWQLVASPVWNVVLAGLPPVFEPGNAGLVPVWQPWPGEGVELAVSRPESVAGATVTVSRARHEVALGRRQRVSKLTLALRASQGEDFPVTLPADAEVTSLTHNDKPMPVRMDGARLVVPLRPGEQAVTLAWKINAPLGLRTQVEDVRLPVESANASTVLTLPGDRWTLGVFGPQRGPAVRFWGILVCSLLAAVALGRLGRSPLGTGAWMLLALGLTQVFLPAALAVVAWLFLLQWRGEAGFARLTPTGHNGFQALLLGLTLAALVTLVAVVAEGLLGDPEMFILGNGSSRTALRWFQARCEAGPLPRPGAVTVSVWWYRLLMLAWALWLAASLLRWLRRGWENFNRGGAFRRPVRAVRQPPPLPVPPGGAAS